jgi:hypothetical protein
MSISYLKDKSGENKSWNDISREERLFCSHLYHAIRSLPDKKTFIAKLNSLESPVKGFTNNLYLSEKANWEVGFEVCFFRDLLFNHNIPIRKLKSNGKKRFSEKRTFDLCLFSDEELVIIEAKAQEKLTSEQCNVIKNDKIKIEELYEVLEELKVENSSPKHIKLVILASSYYFNSPSFNSKKGIGKKFINSKKNNSYLNALISWKQISESIFPADPIFKNADDIYNKQSHAQN